MIDERTRAALARLTDNERTCLMRRLDHQTAKEMAIDLGISPHAVEKRLKMARTKLGVSSSLEAAQLLAASERYGQSGPQASDLGGANSGGQDGGDPAMVRPAWRSIVPYAGLGVFVMSLAAIAFLAAAPPHMPPGAVAPASEGHTVLLSDKPGDELASGVTTLKEREERAGRKIEHPTMIKASPDVVQAFVNNMFDTQDKNHSGFIERAEAPEQTVPVNPIEHKGKPDYGKVSPFPNENEPVVVLKGPMGQAAWISLWDKNADGKVSRQEFMNGNFEKFLAWGVPSNWNGAPKVAAK